MFEGFRIIRTIKKLVHDSSGIPSSLVSENEDLAKQKFYTIEDVAVMIVKMALDFNYISRDNLTSKGERLVADFERILSGDT